MKGFMKLSFAFNYLAYDKINVINKQTDIFFKQMNLRDKPLVQPTDWKKYTQT